MKKFFKVMYRVFYTLMKLDSRIIFNNDAAEYIVWAPHFFTLRFMHGDNFPKTIAIYKTLMESNKSCCIYTRKNIGKFYDKKVFVIPSPMYNIHGFENYVDILFHIVEQLERQNNIVFPSIEQIKLWENKIYMHKKFAELNIRTPKSVIVDGCLNIHKIDLKYPYLIKEPHSCSSNGLHLIKNEKDLYDFWDNHKFSDGLIVQELLNIKRDLRVIVVGDEIVSHYWRINLKDEWRPTSTGHGSKVDFVDFPYQWKVHIIDVFKKLNLDTGAFDLAWENDDTDTEPYILEVSPIYQPNPIPPFDLGAMSYGAWKKSFTFRKSNNYNREMIDCLFDIQRKYAEKVMC